MSPPLEIELKFEVPAHSIARLNRSSLLKGATVASPKPATLVSVYFDTDKLMLRNKGLSLRVRRIGRRYVQTIKQECGESAGLFARNEWERDIGGKQPDLDTARDTALEPLLSKKLRRGLKPLFETRVRRTVYPIHSGDSEIESTGERSKRLLVSGINYRRDSNSHSDPGDNLLHSSHAGASPPEGAWCELHKP